MEGDKQVFDMDNSLIRAKPRSNRRCCYHFVKCFISLLLALVLALIIAAVVFIGVYYKMDFDRTTSILEDRIAMLEAMLNQSSSSDSVTSLPQTMMLTNELIDKVEALNETIMDLQTQVNQEATAVSDRIDDVRDTLSNAEDLIGLTRESLVLGLDQVSQNLSNAEDLIEQTHASLMLNLDQVSQNQRAVYVRWGSSSCPNINGTTMVYSGVAGGTFRGHQGGGSNHLCMPLDPEYTLQIQDGVQGFSAIYPTEYETGFLGSSNRNIPCAVCSVSTRTQALMIPAKTSCPADWTREYFGYLLGEGFLNRRSTFLCTDVSHEGVPNMDGNTDANDMWQVEAQCSILSCPPYNAEGEIQCAVCTR